ncbi:hypothetical protein SCHPADRAFT_503397 [Schizopora paradoxa]|uniref:Uncharacterized protein n=1 Tax=Schizopora paradoxa TaxID=27342 RepID=A0A0H2RGU1_9AGAM|nr:hypothetical protein SCHPADRAFT_503397 [Schizopora paradoxa]
MAHNLSEDLLYAIFLYALPSEFNLTTIGPSNEPWMVPPFTFSLVCRSWRAVVLSHPMLWSKISVKGRIEWVKEDRNPGIRQILEKWLIHSSSAPLRIHLNVDRDDSAYVSNHILPLFVQEIHRWSFVDISVISGEYYFARNQATYSLQCPTSLRFLSLEIFGDLFPSIRIDLSHHDGASNLEHLSLGVGESIRLPDHRDNLRFPRLRSFNYKFTTEGKDLEDLRCILSTCSSLEDLELGITRRSISSTAFIRGSIHLPNLTSLSLAISNQFALRYILDILNCPSLRELSICIQNTQTFESEEDRAFLEPIRVRDSLVRSCPKLAPNLPLEILRLSCFNEHEVCPNYDAALKDLLNSLRKLRTLDLRIYALNRAVLEMLTIPTGAPLDSQLCPSLFEVCLATRYSRETTDISEESIEEMIVSRWKAGSLRAVSQLRTNTWIINCDHVELWNKF